MFSFLGQRCSQEGAILPLSQDGRNAGSAGYLQREVFVQGSLTTYGTRSTGLRDDRHGYVMQARVPSWVLCLDTSGACARHSLAQPLVGGLEFPMPVGGCERLGV